MVGDKKLEKYGEKFNNREKNSENPKEEVILFFSFDVVNSSLYKTVNYHGWAQVLTTLFHKLNGRVKEVIDEAELWRVLGDEAIFIVRIKSEDSLVEYIDKVFKILVTTIEDMKNGIIYDFDAPFSQNEIKSMKLQNVLSLKAAAWIALVSRLSETTEFAENIFEEYDLDNRNRFYEFLGNDIDAGFRISKFTADGRLVVSMELAMLLAKRSNEVKKLNIITYKHLKGIWNNKYYPIIWYHNSDTCGHLKLEDTFEFDSEDQEELIKEYYDNRDGGGKSIIRDKNMFTNTLVALNKIQNDRNLQEKIKRITTHIRSMDNTKKDYLKSPTLELHCVAVCYHAPTKTILIAKRSDSRELDPGKWEFGGAKANKELNLGESIVREYKDDFGIDIELVMDESREEKSPLPIALYQISKSNGCHKGIITLARVFNRENLKLVDKKHSGNKWICENEVDSFDEPAVKDFKSTLKRAFHMFRELEKKNG